MRTIQSCKSELIDMYHKIQTEGKHNIKKAVLNKMRKRAVFLKTCILYLESNPTPLFIRKQLDDTEAKITLRMSYFVLNNINELPKSTVTKLKKEHEKMYDVPKLRDQARTLRFLLK